MSERLVVAWCESRLFVRIGSLSLWRGANFDLAPQPSRHFVCVRSLSFWRGAHFEIARATLSSLCTSQITLTVLILMSLTALSALCACQIALAVARCLV